MNGQYLRPVHPLYAKHSKLLWQQVQYCIMCILYAPLYQEEIIPESLECIKYLHSTFVNTILNMFKIMDT